MSIVLNEEEREEIVFKAKLAEQAERYDDMVMLMRKIAQTGNLRVEERNMLSVAYKNIVGSRRAAWRGLHNLQAHNKEQQDIMTEYKKKVEVELCEHCDAILDLLKSPLIPQAEDTEAKVFYLKMAGDYYRYRAEYLKAKKDANEDSSSENSYELAVKNAHENYSKGLNVAGAVSLLNPEETSSSSAELVSTNPILLGLILNYSVFFYEIIENQDKACELAKNGFDAAVDNLDSLNEEEYKDATLIMQLLRDNITLWTSTDPPMES